VRAHHLLQLLPQLLLQVCNHKQCFTQLDRCYI
jgi:hypothetical protein